MKLLLNRLTGRSTAEKKLPHGMNVQCWNKYTRLLEVQFWYVQVTTYPLRRGGQTAWQWDLGKGGEVWVRVAFQGKGKLCSTIWGTESRLKNTLILCPHSAVTSLQAELTSFQDVEPFERAVSTELQEGISSSVVCSWRNLSTSNHSECAFRTSCWQSRTSQELIQEGWQSIAVTRT